MHELVQDYYGKQLGGSGDLKTSACCDASAVPAWLKPLLERIHPEVLSRYYGCGLVCPPLLEGCRVLDLGSGSGRDVYALAQLVGKSGEVIGVDMTPEMIEKARSNAKKSGVENVEFRLGEIENLPVRDNSVDVVISNCVINLSADKPRVFREIQRVLKPGGRIAISDIALLKQLPEKVRQSIEAYVGCVGGAILIDDYKGIVEAALLKDVRVTFKEASA